ncbi:MAG: alpha-mannosidase, partial [Phycisphaerae bacterium]|nr:alpha-mannosidase [Phycisphaerae bacterium]
ITSSAQKVITTGQSGWTVWNTLSWRRDAVVSLPVEGKVGQVVDCDGTPLPSQIVGRVRNRRLLVAVPNVPSVGCKTIKLLPGKPADCPSPVTAKASRGGIVMENEHLRLLIDKRGQIAQLLDKASGRRLVKTGEVMNRLELYRDNPAKFDAWDIDEPYKTTPVRIGPAQRVEIIADGPLEARIAVTRKVGRSSLQQEIVLRAGSRRIDFETRVDWQETHRLLKVAFPAELSSVTLRGEIQFGHVVRPTHRNTEFEKARFEWPAQKWADLSEAHYGIAVLNDCKYGYDILDGVLRLSLLRAPVAPDGQADKGEHAFTYALLPHNGGFAESDVVRAAYELNVPASVEQGQYATRLSSSKSGGEFSFLQVSGNSVVVETVKIAENGGDLILRLYESAGSAAKVRLNVATPVKTAYECDMLETPFRKLRVSKDGAITLNFRAFEIKTVKIR